MLISNFARRTLRIGVILIVSLLAVEFLMIVLDPYLFKDRYEDDPEMGFRARAYFLNGLGRFGRGDDGTLTNRFGFNDRDYPLTKTPGTFRIVVVGDSFGWAGGLEGNYTALLERMFEDRDQAHKVDIVNTGYSGTHTGEQLIMLNKFGLQYNPDLVILGFFVGNDFRDADPNRKRIVVNGAFFDIDRRYEHRFLGYPIIKQSRIHLFLRQKYWDYSEAKQARKEATALAAATGQPPPEGNMSEENFLNLQKATLAFFDKRTSATKFAPNIQYIFESISAMNELLRARNIKFMVAIYPDTLQVSPTQFEALVKTFQLRREDYDLNLAQDLLKSFLASKQIPYFDLTDRFRTESKQHDLYIFRHPHWNDAGNKLAAEVLFQYLIAQPYEFNPTH
jgi:hypothetical protein